MNRLASIATCLAFGLLAGCSGAPPGGGPDFEVNGTQPPGASTGGDGTSTGGDGASTASTGGDGASTGGGGASVSPPAADPAPSTDTAPSGPTATPTGAPPPPPPPPPTTVSVKIDGAAVMVTKTDLWSEVGGPGEYKLFVNVVGPGIAAGSDFILSATHVGTGCLNTANFVTYRPVADMQYMPTQAACGLAIGALPTAVGGRLKGSFKGTLTSINTATPKHRSVELTFDVLRAK